MAKGIWAEDWAHCEQDGCRLRRAAKTETPAGGTDGRNMLAISGKTANKKSGAPGRTRTSNPQIRSLVLYPIELRVQQGARCVDDGV